METTTKHESILMTEMSPTNIEEILKETHEESKSSSQKPSQKNEQQKETKGKKVVFRVPRCIDALIGMLKKIAITAFGPILEYSLYYYDLFSDSFFTYTMANNCHWRYFATSICIMVSSYFVTVAYLRYHVQETWRKSIMYPYHHGRLLFNQLKVNTQAIWRGEELPEERRKDKIYGHCIMFFETMTESLMQLCLNSVIIREFGLSPNGYERSNQISGLVSSLISVILLFAKRQSLLKENVIPKFSSMSLWKHVLICFLPLLTLFLAFFSVAFTADSLGLIVMSICFMLNPIVAIPLSFSMAKIIDGIQHVIKKIRCNSPSSEGRFKFTISAYLAIICAVQIYLTKQWDAVRETAIKKQSLGAKVQTVVMSSYENYLKFDQCNCSNSTSSCKFTNGTRPDIDIGKYVDFWKLYNIPLLYILLGFFLSIFLYVVVESFVGKQISMKRFILGPQSERNGSTIHNEGEPTDVNEKTSKHSKNYKKKTSAVATVCFVASAIYLLLIFLSPLIFNELVDVDQIFCKDGFYDSNNSTERINCKACACDVKLEYCNKRTGTCYASPSSYPFIVSYLNWYRYAHGAAALTKDLDYAAYEATNAVCNYGFDHHPGTEAEHSSLYASSNVCSSQEDDGVAALKYWYSECPDYYGQGFSQNTGHFTHIVWKSCKSFGLWAQTCDIPGTNYTTTR